MTRKRRSAAPSRPVRGRAAATPRAARTAPPAALGRARFPPAVMDVLRALDAAGHRSWLVGGAVRDLLLGRGRRGASDLDVATPARPDQVQALFRKVIPTGIEHGTVTVLSRGEPVEVTTFRGEGAYLDGRRPSSVTFLDDVDGDLARRDFTVNALAWDPLGRAFRDPFGGRADLRRKLLRAVGDPAARFAEDGLRPLRAARFAAQLGFTVERATAGAIPAALPVTARVSAERVGEELTKLLLAPAPGRGLALLETSGLLSVIAPDVATLPPDDRAHALAAAAAAPAVLELRLAALFHALAAAQPALGAARRAREALLRLRFPTRVADEASRLVAEHGCLGAAGRQAWPEAPAQVRAWLARVGRERAAAQLQLAAADARALGPAARARRELAGVGSFARRARASLRTSPPLAVADLALDGRAVMDLLGISGPAVGVALRHLLARVVEDPALNTPAALASELTGWSARPPP